MKLYQINLPKRDNRGADYGGAHAYFCERALDVAGGFTIVATAKGLWRDADARARLYDDESVIYQVACEPDQWAELCAYTKRKLFQDQVCLFVAELGEAQLI